MENNLRIAEHVWQGHLGECMPAALVLGEGYPKELEVPKSRGFNLLSSWYCFNRRPHHHHLKNNCDGNTWKCMLVRAVQQIRLGCFQASSAS